MSHHLSVGFSLVGMVVLEGSALYNHSLTTKPLAVPGRFAASRSCYSTSQSSVSHMIVGTVLGTLLLCIRFHKYKCWPSSSCWEPQGHAVLHIQLIDQREVVYRIPRPPTTILECIVPCAYAALRFTGQTTLGTFHVIACLTLLVTAQGADGVYGFLLCAAELFRLDSAW